MPTRNKATFYLSDEHLEKLAARGAVTDRSHGPFGRSSVLRRRLDFAYAVLEESDPRRTHDLPQPFFDLAIDLLADAHELAPDTIKVLDAHFARLHELPELATRARVDVRAFLEAIGQLPYAQRFFLVDHAEQVNARRGRRR
jgi:hypothetical protein